MNSIALILIVSLPVFLLSLALGVSSLFGEKAANYFIALAFISLFLFENQIIQFLMKF